MIPHVEWDLKPRRWPISWAATAPSSLPRLTPVSRCRVLTLSKKTCLGVLTLSVVVEERHTKYVAGWLLAAGHDGYYEIIRPGDFSASRVRDFRRYRQLRQSMSIPARLRFP